MKKLLSVVLVLAMILGSFSMVFATDYKDVKDSDTNGEAINVLSGLGVIGGYADNTFRPEGIVTRAEMATMIVNALGIPVKGGAATQFSDVPATHWASGYINYAASVGFIAGYTDGTFKPEKTVSYNEAITMIVASLGYSLDSLTGTYPGAFINKAKGLGILDTCTTTGTTGAVRGDIAQLVYDALRCEMGAVNKDNEFVSHWEQTGKHDRMIDRLGAIEHAYAIITDTMVDNADINIAKYLGAKASYFYDKDDANVIIAMGEVKSETYVGSLDDLKDDYTVDGLATVTGAGMLFENGENVGAIYTSVASNVELTFNIEVSGKHAKIVSAMAWTPNQDDMAVAEDIADDLAKKEPEILTVKFELTDENEIDDTYFALYGVDSLSEIKDDNVVYVYAGKRTGLVRKIEVGTEVITGEVTKVSKDDEYTIGGKLYEVADVADVSANDVKIEAKGDFYLTYAGDIYYFDGENTVDVYAMLMDYDNSKTIFESETFYVKAFLADGTVATYEVDSDAKATCAAIMASAPTSSAIIVKLSLDDENIVTDMIGEVFASGSAISAKGVVGTQTIASDAVVFEYDGTDRSDKDNYSVKKLADILDKTPTNMARFVDSDDATKIVAVVVEGVSGSKAEYAIVNGDYEEYAKGKYEVTALIDGAETTFNTKSKVLAATKYTTADAASFSLLKVVTEGDYVTALTPTDFTGAKAVMNVTKDITVNASKISDTVNAYALDDEVVAYLYDVSDEKWTVVKELKSVRKDKLSAMYLFDIDSVADDEYDIVIMVQE